ncbi:carbon-nitrogen family hydrolase [bacterium]|nr:carbon-nitrogen family hydrolase [bacterium]
MKISIFQMQAEKGVLEKNLDKAEHAAKEASGLGSNILILPEYWATGYDLGKLSGLATPVNKGVFSEVARISKENKIAIIGASPSVEKGRVYNTAFYYNKDGVLKEKYHKMHLFNIMHENDYFYAGSRHSVFSTEWAKAGMATCFDLRFPELFRRITLDGAKIVFVPGFWPEPRLEHWRTLLKARAIENLVFVAGCNSAALSDSTELGFSALIGPRGDVILEAAKDEVLLHAEIDIDEVDKYRKDFPVLEQRRSGEYGEF